MTPEQSSKTDQLVSMFMPLEADYLLLPQSAVLDISFHITIIDPSLRMKDWLVGKVYWHGKNIDVVSFEVLIGEKHPMEGGKGKAAICSLPGEFETNTLGILIRAAPRIAQLKREDFQGSLPNPSEDFVLAAVPYEQTKALIPDLSALAKTLSELKSK